MGSMALALRIAFFVAQVQVHALLLRDRRSTGVSGHDSVQSCSTLVNRQTHHTMEVGVGTPPQKFGLIPDTGSDALVVQSCECRKTTMCKETEDCFTGENGKSSSYVGSTGQLVLLSYGTGNIMATPATDVVHVGQVSAVMESNLLLMSDKSFVTAYDFEGLLGLGVPSWVYFEGEADNGTRPSFGDADLKAGDKVRSVGFLEVAKVNLFSICFNAGQNGALWLNPPAMPSMLKQIGRRHWTLGLAGISAGSSSAQISVCSGKSKDAGDNSPCAAIPDSGTTHIMGPKKDVDRILADLCDQWPRCQKFKDDPPHSENDPPTVRHMRENATSVEAFKLVLSDCYGWMTQEKGISEVPSIFFHLESGDGKSEVLEITAMAYVYTTKSLLGDIECRASFSPYELNLTTKEHGPAWILGAPLFYEYQVGYGLKPPSIGFNKAPCNLCSNDETTDLLLTNGSRGMAFAPRRMDGEARLPSFNVNDKL